MKHFIKMLSAGFLVVVLGLALSPWFVLAAEPPKDPKVLKVGFINNITGPISWIGVLHTNCANLAVKEINAAGGIAGIPMEVIFEDNKTGDPKAGLSAMNKLIFIDKVPATLVTFSASILAAQPLAAENKVLQINPGGWSPNLLDKPYLFSNKITGDVMVENAAKAAWGKGYRKAAILHPNDTAGVYCMKLVEEVWKKWGGEVVAKETAPMGTTDFQVHLTKIKSARPDVLFLYFYGLDSGYAIKQNRELGLNVQMYGMLWSNEVYKASGPAGAGFIYSDDYWEPEKAGPWAQRFVESYTQTYGKREDKIPSWAVNVYEAVYIVKDLIAEARKMGGDYYKGESLKDVLLKKRKFKSVYGSDLVFRENGSCMKPVGLYQVQADGSAKLLDVYMPKE
jgi:branched-chain amino acid transport system substrate-binding protein